MTPVATARRSRIARSLARLGVVAIVLAASLTIVGPVSHPAPVAAGTADSMEGLLLGWINDARTKRGLPPLKLGWRLERLAGDRAEDMAAAGRMAHTSCLSCLLRSGGVSFNNCAEVIAWTSYPWGYDAARAIFNGWKGSSGHWTILMSRSFTRIGLGVAYRSQSKTTYAAGLLAR